MNTTANAQDWLDTNLYPFKRNYIQLQQGHMHYVDEGKGEVILFVHGTPSWSFLYRDFIKSFSKTHRCIALDHLGFGLSDKPGDFEGTPQAHSQNLEEFINKLGLNNLTLVVHDFGGPIALAWAARHADKVKRVVLFNSWLWETATDPKVQKADKLINSFIGRFLYLNLNISPKVLLKKGFADPQSLPKEVHLHYCKPFRDKQSRYGLYRIAQSLAGSSAWYGEQWNSLELLEDKPWLILWGVKDQFFDSSFLKKWQERLPNAQVRRFDCGHFVQEEASTEAINTMEHFINYHSEDSSIR